MRCNRHSLDDSSSIGVCASCLRERLDAVIGAQAQADALAHHHHHRRRPPNPYPHHHHHHHQQHESPLIFPRSVSPYISHSKSIINNDDDDDHNNYDSHNRFFRTPQVGFERRKKRVNKFGLISDLFRSRSRKCGPLDPDSDAHTRVSGYTDFDLASTASASSSSWFSGLFHRGSHRRENNKSKSLFELEKAAGEGKGREYCRRDRGDRGMSPEDDNEWDVEDDRDFFSPDVKTTPSNWKRTPSIATGKTSTSSSICRVRPSPPRSITMRRGFGFWLSPLVRFGAPPEISYAGEIRDQAAKPPLAMAASFCGNRSRKLADFGRLNCNL